MENTMRRVVVTGLGVISPVGGGVLEQLEVRRPRHRPHHSF